MRFTNMERNKLITNRNAIGITVYILDLDIRFDSSQDWRYAFSKYRLNMFSNEIGKQGLTVLKYVYIFVKYFPRLN